MSRVRSGFGLQYDPTARARANACLLRDGTEVMTGAIRVASTDSFTLLNNQSVATQVDATRGHWATASYSGLTMCGVIKRGTERETFTFRSSWKSSAESNSYECENTFSTSAAIGVTLDVALVGGGAMAVLMYTTTNTGANATLTVTSCEVA